MNSQLHESGRGQRLDDPLYYLQQIFSLVADKHRPSVEKLDLLFGNPDMTHITNKSIVNEYDTYEDVTINIWLFKGTHHFVQCTDHLFLKYYSWKKDYCSDALRRLEEDYIDVCYNMEYLWYLFDVSEGYASGSFTPSGEDCYEYLSDCKEGT